MGAPAIGNVSTLLPNYSPRDDFSAGSNRANRDDAIRWPWRSNESDAGSNSSTHRTRCDRLVARHQGAVQEGTLQAVAQDAVRKASPRQSGRGHFPRERSEYDMETMRPPTASNSSSSPRWRPVALNTAPSSLWMRWKGSDRWAQPAPETRAQATVKDSVAAEVPAAGLRLGSSFKNSKSAHPPHFRFEGDAPTEGAADSAMCARPPDAREVN